MEPQTFLIQSLFEEIAPPPQDLHWLRPEAEEGIGSSSSGSPVMEGGGGGGVEVDGVSSTSSLPVFPSQQPLSHPLALAKHICAICGDRASGKHYGVFSCEGCKGFFKRTVRKELSYACRERQACVIDKRQRNRCQFCRYRKCQQMGMRREAVQEERHRLRSQLHQAPPDQLPESTSSFCPDMSPQSLLAAELAASQPAEVDVAQALVKTEAGSAEEELGRLVRWARAVPHFAGLPVEEQATLLGAGWAELLVAWRAYDGLPEATAGDAFAERIRAQLMRKMAALGLERSELACLRAIVLFNPDVRGLRHAAAVEALREKVYVALEDVCREQRPTETGRLAKLLLRLPALRSIGLASADHHHIVPPQPDHHAIHLALAAHALQLNPQSPALHLQPPTSLNHFF